ncbi:hypothetical protein MNBD_CHLOROFLEXI01-5387 [hydrothermal vent metagenome]|uniref:Uncharacterized protein n=1 Tax=hydrothermal vent metagenome TaxID=652676 RepID=A0A3B0V351_9ZZZZ
MTIPTQTIFPPRTILDENGNWTGVILGVSDYQRFLGLLAEHSDWNTLPAYLQDAIDNMLADEAEQEGGETISLQEMLSAENDG